MRLCLPVSCAALSQACDQVGLTLASVTWSGDLCDAPPCDRTFCCTIGATPVRGQGRCCCDMLYENRGASQPWAQQCCANFCNREGLKLASTWRDDKLRDRSARHIWAPKRCVWCCDLLHQCIYALLSGLSTLLNALVIAETVAKHSDLSS